MTQRNMDIMKEDNMNRIIDVKEREKVFYDFDITNQDVIYNVSENSKLVVYQYGINIDNNITDWSKIKTDVKDSLGDFVWKETKRRPMIMPIIMEV